MPSEPSAEGAGHEPERDPDGVNVRQVATLVKFVDLVLVDHRVRRDDGGARVWRCSCGSVASRCPVQRARVASGYLRDVPWPALTEDLAAGRAARRDVLRHRVVGRVTRRHPHRP